MDLKENFAVNLSRYRKEAKLTQAELAEKLNYSDKAVSKWERGESVPDIYALKNIADCLCLLRIDHPLAVRTRIVSQHPVQIHLGLACLEILLN